MDRMEWLRQTIGVEVPAADSGGAEVVRLERSPFGLAAPRLDVAPPHPADGTAEAEAEDASPRLRFTTTLRPVENGLGPRLAAEPALEALLGDAPADDPAAEALGDLLRLADPGTVDVLRDPARVPPTERAVRAAILAVAARARLCAWDARELRPEGARTLIVEHGVDVERGDGGAPRFVPLGARRFRYAADEAPVEDGVGLLEPSAEGPWLAVDDGVPRPVAASPWEIAPIPPQDDPRERARRRALGTPWPSADARVRHLATTLDAPDRVTPARLKTLVRLLGSARPDPLASLLFAERVVPMHAVVHVLAPDGAARDRRLADVLRSAERRLDRWTPEESFRLTRLLVEATGGDREEA
ncbi:MAG: hypothetical protein ACF8XB_16680 [Planctomycetota bacterium JB042]